MNEKTYKCYYPLCNFFSVNIYYLGSIQMPHLFYTLLVIYKENQIILSWNIFRLITYRDDA